MSEPKKTTKPTKETSASDSKKTVGEKLKSYHFQGACHPESDIIQNIETLF